MTVTTAGIDRAEIEQLNARRARQLACDVAENLLPAYENIFPHDTRLSEALAAAGDLIDLPTEMIAERLRNAPYIQIERSTLMALHGANKISKRPGRYLTMTIAMGIASAVHHTLYPDAHDAAYRVCNLALDVAELQSRWNGVEAAVVADEIRARIVDILDSTE